MCGRYTITDPERFFAEFSILVKRPSLEPRYNVAPNQLVAAIRIVPPERAARIDMLVWGLVPAWVTDREKRSAAGLINARIETVATKPSFAASFRDRRCVLVADGFYEWKKSEKRKLPYLIRARDAGPLAIAGVWEPVATAIGRPADSCAIITRPAVPPVDSLHDRMPAILDPADVQTWLDPEMHDVDGLKALLGRAPVDFDLLPVSTRVNSPANDDAECIEPASGDGLGGPAQRRLF